MNRIMLPLALCLFSASTAVAQANPTSDERCLECHASPNGSAAASEPALGIAMQAYRVSVHGELGCVECHTDATDDECRSGLALVDCGSCHAAERKDFRVGVHAATDETGTPVTCTTCHGTHETLPKDHPDSTVYPTNLPATCSGCHDSEDHELPKRARGVTLEDYVASAHYEGLTEDGLLTSASCIGCHGNHDMRATTDPASRVFRDNIPRTCGSCHEGALDDYTRSSHGQALELGSADTPICTDCHGEHAIFDHEDPRSSVFATQISASTCPQCHSAEHINRRYGMAEGQVDTHRDTYHGLAEQFGDTEVANCASCHGAHLVLPASDPESTVHEANLATTCASCHPDAGPNFAAGSVHRPAESAGASYFRFVDVFYFVVILVTIGGMLLHNSLDYYATIRARLRANRRKRRYVRFDRSERLQHVGLVITFVVLATTGFALKYPQSFWVQWLIDTPAAFLARNVAHRVAAVLFVGLSIYHVHYLITTRRGRSQMKAMIPGKRDLRDLKHQLGYYLGSRSTPARFPRYSYGEKVEYLALVWGSIIMVVTGFILWFEQQALGWMPKWAWDLAELVHLYEAWLATLSILVWHLYHVAFRPSGNGVSFAMVTGELTEEEMRHEHAGELEELAVDNEPGESAPVLAPGESQRPAPVRPEVAREGKA